MIGCSPDDWNDWLEGNGTISIGGRLGRLLLADLNLTSAAPIASEWALQDGTELSVEIEGFDDQFEASCIKLRGRIDRVDHLVLDEPLLERLAERGLYAEGAEGIPLFLMEMDRLRSASSSFETLRPLKGQNPVKMVFDMLRASSRKFN